MKYDLKSIEYVVLHIQRTFPIRARNALSSVNKSALQSHQRRQNASVKRVCWGAAVGATEQRNQVSNSCFDHKKTMKKQFLNLQATASCVYAKCFEKNAAKYEPARFSSVL